MFNPEINRDRLYPDYPLSGVLTEKAQPEKHYRVSGPEALQQGGRRDLSGWVGRVCEENLLNLWGRLVVPSGNFTDLRRAFQEVRSRFAPLLNGRGVDYASLNLQYQLFGERIDPWDEGAPKGQTTSVPRNEALWGLFQGVDSFFGTTFGKKFGMLPLTHTEAEDGGEKLIHSNVRYLIEGAQILARALLENTDPLPRGAILLPNVRVVNVTQLDAVLLPQTVEFDRSGPFDLVSFLREAPGEPVDWQVVEVKVVLRDRYLGQRKLPHVLSRDMAQFQNRLGKVALWWAEKENGDFPFPGAVRFCYPRGTCNHVFHTISLDHSLFQMWVTVLRLKPDSGLFEKEDLLDIEKLIPILERARENAWRREEPERGKRRKALEQLKEGMGEPQQSSFGVIDLAALAGQGRLIGIIEMPLGATPATETKRRPRRRLGEEESQYSMFSPQVPQALRLIHEAGVDEFWRDTPQSDEEADARLNLWSKLDYLMALSREDLAGGWTMPLSHLEVKELEKRGFKMLSQDVLARFSIVPNWFHHPLSPYLDGSELNLARAISIVDLDPKGELRGTSLRLILVQTEYDWYDKHRTDDQPYALEEKYPFALCWVREEDLEAALKHETNDFVQERPREVQPSI